jgi:hypothetical protein
VAALDGYCWGNQMLDIKQYPLVLRACTALYNGSFNATANGPCTEDEIAPSLAQVGLPADAFQAAEVVLLTQPAVMQQYEAQGYSDNGAVELVVGAYAMHMGMV